MNVDLHPYVRRSRRHMPPPGRLAEASGTIRLPDAADLDPTCHEDVTARVTLPRPPTASRLVRARRSTWTPIAIGAGFALAVVTFALLMI